MEVQLDAVGGAAAVPDPWDQGEVAVDLRSDRTGGPSMPTATPWVRIVGHGGRLRVRTKGDWSTNAVVGAA